MSDDNTDDLLPSGFNARASQEGDLDFGVVNFPDAVWIGQMNLMDIMAGRPCGIAYRLMWGSVDSDGVGHLDGELWLEPSQMAGITEEYLSMRDDEPTEGDGGA
jgi:hypothetical protein